jgi:hypothetical protein
MDETWIRAIQELLGRAESANETANAVQSFGQEDFISVISVTRTKALGAATVWSNRSALPQLDERIPPSCPVSNVHMKKDLSS